MGIFWGRSLWKISREIPGKGVFFYCQWLPIPEIGVYLSPKIGGGVFRWWGTSIGTSWFNWSVAGGFAPAASRQGFVVAPPPPGGGGDSDTFFSERHLRRGGGVSSNRGIAGRNQTPIFFFFFRFQKGGGAHVQKGGGAFIEKCFKRGGGARAGCAPPKSATEIFKHNSENLMKIGWKIWRLWHFDVSQIFKKYFLTSPYD